MGIIELILIAIGLSMDAFAVAICKGLAVKKAGMVKSGVKVLGNAGTVWAWGESAYYNLYKYLFLLLLDKIF